MHLTFSSTSPTESSGSTNENRHLVLEYNFTTMFVPCFNDGCHSCSFAFIKHFHKSERNYLRRFSCAGGFIKVADLPDFIN